MKSILLLFALAASVLAYGLEPSGFDLVGFPEFTSSFQPRFSSSVSFGYTTGRYGSYGEGTYLGSMQFSLHPKLDATVEMGYSRLMTFSGGERDFGSVLGGIQLDWRPSDRTVFSIVYRGVLPEDDLNLGGL